MSVVMVWCGDALSVPKVSRCPRWYLRAYYPERFGGRGYVEWTMDVAKARRFNTVGEAMEEWKRVPANRPTRDDGKPNRPLTAYHVSFEEAPDG